MITCTALVLGLHLVSAHFPEKDYHNNENFGAYANCDGWNAGVYKNTLSRPSFYGGYQFQVYGPIDLNVGLVTGYKKERYTVDCPPALKHDKKKQWNCWEDRGIGSKNVTLMLAPSVHYGPVRLWGMPKVGKMSGVLHLSVEKQF